MSSYHNDRDELSIAAACYGGDVFEYVGSAGNSSVESARFVIANIDAAVKRLATRAGYDHTKPAEVRWGAQDGMVYCVGWYREPRDSR